MDKMNQLAKQVKGQRSFRSQVIVQTHTQPTDCFTWTTKVVANNNDDNNSQFFCVYVYKYGE